MNRVVLGLNAYSHDAGVALVVEGRLVFAAEQERYDRVKHSAAFPVDAIAAALAHAGLAPDDVDCVAFPWRRDMARLQKALYFLKRLPRSLAFLREKPEALPARFAYLRSVARLERDLRAAGLRAPVRHVEHHRAHAAQAYRFGPADRAALLTADGMGEWTATATWRAAGGEMRVLRQRDYPHSLGKVYAAVTQHLGFRPDADEGKTMGLAPYGDRSLCDAFGTLVRAHPERLYDVDLSAFAYPDGRTEMAGAPFRRRVAGERAAIARAAQETVENVVLDIARRLRTESGATHLGLAGGLFLNCVLNGRLLRESGFESLFVFPAAGDAGAAAGAAALVADAPRALLPDPFLGDGFSSDAIDRALAGRAVRVVADPAERAAETLADGGTVGWFQGRMEFGPRALGARSILADPRDPGIRDRVNRTIKFREDFRPFAPAVLEEAAGDWFEDPAPSPYMLLTFQARPERRARIPGVVHVDGSARVQTVAAGGGHPLRAPIEAFARRTGVPLLLNTSFNVRGDPIVRTPAEALRAFDDSALDLLVLGDRVVERG